MPASKRLASSFAPMRRPISTWGQGLAAEAARVLIRYGFEALGFNEIIASTDASNEASIRVMEKAGMTFQKRVLLDGLDTIYYVISRATFEAVDLS